MCYDMFIIISVYANVRGLHYIGVITLGVPSIDI